jgi:hypothetical protein
MSTFLSTSSSLVTEKGDLDVFAADLICSKPILRTAGNHSPDAVRDLLRVVEPFSVRQASPKASLGSLRTRRHIRLNRC